MITEHLSKVVEQLKSGNAIGRRGTPVISFWPMREKWEKFGEYWEQFSTDGDVFINPEDGELWGPAELQLVYFRVPGTFMVCQLAYVLHEEGIDTVARANRRIEAVKANIKTALLWKTA